MNSHRSQEETVGGVVMIGAFPPPVHGMAAINSAVHQRLVAAGAIPRVIDIAATDLKRSLRSRLARSQRVIRGLARFAVMRCLEGGTLYMSVSGGLGQVYEIMFLLLARRRGMRIYLHHHSFAYLDAPSRITGWLIKAGGPSATHIALSPGMSEELCRVYPAVRTAIPISNAAFQAPPFESPELSVRTTLRTLGYLSNISIEKGVFEFLDLLAAARAKGLPLEGRIAGAFQDEHTELRVRARLSELPHVKYVGPKYDAEKHAFLASIDALVFPTRYVNEAEPLVLHEAMSHSLPIIAYARGAIGEVMPEACGLRIPPGSPFVPDALVCLERWLAQQNTFQSASESAIRRFKALNEESAARWKDLLTSIIGRRTSAASGSCRYGCASGG